MGRCHRPPPPRRPLAFVQVYSCAKSSAGLPLSDTEYWVLDTDMSCRELAALRAEATELNKKLTQQRSKARLHEELDRGNQLPGRTDYEPLLRRKLERLSQTIEQHKEQHGCEE